MKSIWKFHFDPADTVAISAPRGATPLSVGMNQDRFTIWCEVEMDGVAPRTTLTLRMVGIGHPLPDDADRCLGRIEYGDLPLIFHVYTVRAPVAPKPEA